MTNISARFTENKYIVTFAFVISLFLLWGIAITMGDVLNRHFQNVLGVTKAESGLVQFSIFGAYAVMGIPAGLFMKRFGYKNGVLLGLALYAFGAFPLKAGVGLPLWPSSCSTSFSVLCSPRFLVSD
jgi:MFS transporter, FHS family, L-fucose permease